jgi:hypothetical protein|nr:MAG: hypothetical protein J07AB56_13210 [Candidatus Nanosalinarum sp. J07AB56]
MKGMQSTGGEPVNVSSDEDADRDRKRSLKILVAAGILSGAVTLVAVFA